MKKYIFFVYVCGFKIRATMKITHIFAIFSTLAKFTSFSAVCTLRLMHIGHIPLHTRYSLVTRLDGSHELREYFSRR